MSEAKQVIRPLEKPIHRQPDLIKYADSTVQRTMALLELSQQRIHESLRILEHTSRRNLPVLTRQDVRALGHTVQRLRLSRRLTHADMAAASGEALTATWLRQLEQGQIQTIRPNKLCSLASVLRITLSELLREAHIPLHRRA